MVSTLDYWDWWWGEKISNTYFGRLLEPNYKLILNCARFEKEIIN